MSLKARGEGDKMVYSGVQINHDRGVNIERKVSSLISLHLMLSNNDIEY